MTFLNRFLIFLALLASLIAASSCGGAAPSALANLSGVPLSIDVAWPARTKDINPTPSAQSLIVALPGALSDGSNFSWEIDRDADTTAHTNHYASPTKILPGIYPYTITFYTDPGGTGSVAATANGTATIDNDGNGLTTVTAQTTVTNVLVPTGQGVTQGSTSQLVFTATDQNNNVVAVSPGSAVWSVQAGSANVSITPDGVLSFIQVGAATVVATVDGVPSFPQTVTANSNGTTGITVTISPKTQTLTILGHIQFGATVTNDPSNRGVSYSTVDINGKVISDGRITPTGYYTPPGIPGDHYVRATSNADNTKFDTATITVINQ